MKSFDGNVLFLERSDINTDEIIPAKYLSEISKEALRPHLLEDLRIDDFNSKTDIIGKSAIITQSNFGCGSSREHAVWALEYNGIDIVIAKSFARIFRQNMFNCGMMAIAIPSEKVDNLFEVFKSTDTYLDTDVDRNKVKVYNDINEITLSYELSDFEKELIRAGGWLQYANQHY